MKQRLVMCEEYDSLKREMQMLLDLGLDEYEVQYLIHLRMKQEARSKWLN